jgi:hypothetical protein
MMRSEVWRRVGCWCRRRNEEWWEGGVSVLFDVEDVDTFTCADDNPNTYSVQQLQLENKLEDYILPDTHLIKPHFHHRNSDTHLPNIYRLALANTV